MDRQEDRLLLERLQRGDQRAFRELVEAHQQRVYRFIYRMLGNRDEAQEVAQEVFLAAFRFIGNFRGESSLLTWLFRISSNMCKNRIRYNFRRHKGQQAGFDEMLERPDFRPIGERPSTPESLVSGRQLGVAVQDAINRLPEEFRETLVLRDLELLTYEEIQQMLGIPEGTIKSRLHRARSMVARMLRDHLEGQEL